jgi:hypothetical protein
MEKSQQLLCQSHNGQLERLDGRLNVLTETIRGIEKHVENNSKTIIGIHELSKNVALLAQDIDSFTKSINNRITIIEERQIKQGERIGGLETKPAKKLEERWEKVFMSAAVSIISMIITAVATYFVVT